jgi:hypothetical protein
MYQVVVAAAPAVLFMDLGQDRVSAENSMQDPEYT